MPDGELLLGMGVPDNRDVVGEEHQNRRKRVGTRLPDIFHSTQDLLLFIRLYLYWGFYARDGRRVICSHTRLCHKEVAGVIAG